MTKTLNQIIFFSSTKIRIFFSATLGIRIFFGKKTITSNLNNMHEQTIITQQAATHTSLLAKLK
jgi:hypothetical protein